MTQITKKQHFVPKFYLKRFAKAGQIQVFDMRARRIGKPRPYVSVCYKRFFYAAETGVQDEISQAVECVFSQIEDVCDKALPEIIERAVSQQLINSDLYVLAYFKSTQWLRTPSFRERLQKIQAETQEWMLKQRASLPGFQDYICSTADGREISDEQIEEVKRFIKSGEYDIRNNNAQHLNFIDEGKFNGFCNLFLAKKWRIIISARPCHFITSDNPVAEVIPPRTELTPVTFMDRRHLLALTPDILIETCRPDSMNPEQQPVDRVSYHTANEKGVLMFNKVLVNNAHQFAYAPRTDEFEQLLKAIQLGRK